MDRHFETDSLASDLEARGTAQRGQNQGDVGNEATNPLPNQPEILETGDVSADNPQKFERKWIPEHSNLLGKERSGEDVV